MHGKERLFDLDELSRLSGVAPRTIRYYIQRELLPSPGTGRGTKYDEGYLNRLRLIRHLQGQHLPLEEIKSRMDGLSDGAVFTAVEQSKRRPSSAADYVNSVLNRSEHTRSVIVSDQAQGYSTSKPGQSGRKASWERYEIDEGLELHVRRPSTREKQRRVERILAAAERILNE